jgi:hypothetical protein
MSGSSSKSNKRRIIGSDDSDTKELNGESIVNGVLDTKDLSVKSNTTSAKANDASIKAKRPKTDSSDDTASAALNMVITALKHPSSAQFHKSQTFVDAALEHLTPKHIIQYLTKYKDALSEKSARTLHELSGDRLKSVGNKANNISVTPSSISSTHSLQSSTPPSPSPSTSSTSSSSSSSSSPSTTFQADDAVYDKTDKNKLRGKFVKISSSKPQFALVKFPNKASVMEKKLVLTANLIRSGVWK